MYNKIVKLKKILDREIVLKNLISLNYQFKEGIYRIVKPYMPDPIFILGCSRAGTTVTFETIRQSPELISFPYEIPQFWHSLYGPWDNGWQSEVATAENANPRHREKAFGYFHARLGKGWVLDKSCINILRIRYLYELFPQAQFIYIHRDGRDNINSLIEGWRHSNHFGLSKLLGKIPADIRINHGEFDDWRFFLPPGWQDYNDANLEEVCALQWISANQLALEAKASIPSEQWIQIKYEDIFETPVEMFQKVFEKLGIVFTENIKQHCADLNKRPTSIVKGLPKKEKWKDQNAEAIENILPMIETTMRDLGYY